MLMDVWNDSKRYRRLSMAARRTVRKRFTVESVAHEFDRVFQRVQSEIADGAFERPPALHWGEARAAFGDVLPPPSMIANVTFAGLS